MSRKVCRSGIFSLKVPLLNHRVQDIKKYGTATVLDASTYKQYKVKINIDRAFYNAEGSGNVRNGSRK